MDSPPFDGPQMRALCRHSAVSFIEQCKNSGKSFRASLKAAAALCWEGRYYSARTLEGWYYDHQSEGFGGLLTPARSDKGSCRALSPAESEAILDLRRQHPKLTIKALVRGLLDQGKLTAGSFSLQSVYRLLQREGLDRTALSAHGLIADAQRAGAGSGGVYGPTKAWECQARIALLHRDTLVHRREANEFPKCALDE